MNTCTYRWLFYKNFFISAFTFGGGYVVIPMLQKYFVEEKHFITQSELMDMAAIAQSSPGAIALNLAVLSGYRVKGFRGALISAFASILPPFIIIFIVSQFYQIFQENQMVRSIMRGMEAGVIALIVDLVIDMTMLIAKEKNNFMIALIPIAFCLNFFFQISVIWILFGVCLVCILEIQRKRGWATWKH